jgi:ribosome biogenesis GTPase / thiamine phosphate phosphatase
MIPPQMGSKRNKPQREKDLTTRYHAGSIDDDRLEQSERFSGRASGAQQRKMEKTALMRLAEEESSGAIDALPVGQVIQVYSLFCDVESEGVVHLCVVRKTLAKVSETAIVVGDHVRLRTTGGRDEQGRPEAVIEQVLPRKTLLTRSDSFKAIVQHPIVANADQMLIVASLWEPEVRWGLVDRMIIAAQGGGLAPIICLNKIDLRDASDGARAAYAHARQALAHYKTLNVRSLETSVPESRGLDDLRDVLRDKTTVLSGHSGVGKSTLINSIQPALDLRTGAISGYTGKGRHTTTSAKRFPLDFGGQVIDTPGVKLFGLWGISRQNLPTYFPDLADNSAPDWRRESYQRILESLPPDSAHDPDTTQRRRM